MFYDFTGDYRVVAPGKCIGTVEEIRVPGRSVVTAPPRELGENRCVTATVVEHLAPGWYSWRNGAIEKPAEHLHIAGLVETVVVFEVPSGLRFPADNVSRMDRNEIACETPSVATLHPFVPTLLHIPTTERARFSNRLVFLRGFGHRGYYARDRRETARFDRADQEPTQ